MVVELMTRFDWFGEKSSEIKDFYMWIYIYLYILVRLLVFVMLKNVKSLINGLLKFFGASKEIGEIQKKKFFRLKKFAY